MRNVNGWMISTIILVIICSGLLANITLKTCPGCPACNTVDCVEVRTDTVYENNYTCDCPDAVDECIEMIDDVERLKKVLNDERNE